MDEIATMNSVMYFTDLTWTELETDLVATHTGDIIVKLQQMVLLFFTMTLH